MAQGSSLGDVWFVLNPRSGRAGKGRSLAAACAEAAAQAGRRAVVLQTRTPQEAAETARQAHEQGAAALFGCGGDGTLAALLQGLPPGSPTALGAVPLGTANVWAYETRLPRQPMAAIDAQLRALNGEQGAVLQVDSGRIWAVDADGAPQSQRFLLMASWGLDAAAVEGIVGSERRTRAKRLLGEPAYLLSAIREAVGREAWPLTLRVDGGEPFSADVAMLTIGNTRNLGTWLEVNPKATAVDGELDVLLVEGSPWRALAMSPLARSGLLPNGPGVRNLRCRRLEVSVQFSGQTPPPVQVDGDPGRPTAYAVEVEPQALTALCPFLNAPVLGG